MRNSGKSTASGPVSREITDQNSHAHHNLAGTHKLQTESNLHISPLTLDPGFLTSEAVPKPDSWQSKSELVEEFAFDDGRPRRNDSENYFVECNTKRRDFFLQASDRIHKMPAEIREAQALFMYYIHEGISDEDIASLSEATSKNLNLDDSRLVSEYRPCKLQLLRSKLFAV